MTAYTQHYRYSVVRDCSVARLSLFDKRGGEFWIEVPVYQNDGSGRIPWREVRSAALDRVADAMARGDEPGEVDGVKLGP